MFDNSVRQEKEQRWALGLRQGDQHIMSLLYDAYAPVLLGLISRIVRDKEIAETVLLDTFLAIWKQKATYDPARMGLLTWMIQLAKEKALMHLKSGRFSSFPNKQEIATFEMAEQRSGNGQETPEQTGDFCNLKPDEKAALDLIYLKGYTCAQAAAALHISEETLKNSLKMAVKQLGTKTPS